jgi:hypothetical protein
MRQQWEFHSLTLHTKISIRGVRGTIDTLSRVNEVFDDNGKLVVS